MIPLVSLFWLPLAYDSYTLPKIVLAAALLFLTLVWKWPKLGPKPLSLPMLVMLTVVLVSSWLSGDLLVNFFGKYSARWLALGPLLLCLVAYHLPPQRVHAPMRLAGGLCAAVALVSLLFDWVTMGGRACLPLGSPPTLGAALAMCMPFCWGTRPRDAMLTALVLGGLIATGSRGPMLAVCFAALVYGGAEIRKRLSLNLMIGLIVLAVGCAFVMNALDHSKADAIRLLIWKSSLKVWWAHPLFGCGAESYTDAWRAFRDAHWISVAGPMNFVDHAHNDILEALAAWGVLGLSAYLWLLWKSYKLMTQREYWGIYGNAKIASLAALFVCAKFNAVPFPCLFAAAIILGSMEDSLQATKMMRFSQMGMVAGVLLGFANLLYADVIFYASRRVLNFQGIMRAAELAPHELFYQATEADLVTRKWLGTGERDQELLGWALFIARVAQKRHPRSVQAQHIATQTLHLIAKRDPAYFSAAHEEAAKLRKMDPMLDFSFRVAPLQAK